MAFTSGQLIKATGGNTATSITSAQAIALIGCASLDANTFTAEQVVPSLQITNYQIGYGGAATPSTAFIVGQYSTANGTNGGDLQLKGGSKNQASDASGAILLTTARVGSFTYEERLVVEADGAIRLSGIATGNAPALSASGTARMYFNNSTNHLMVSVNGGAYGILV